MNWKRWHSWVWLLGILILIGLYNSLQGVIARIFSWEFVGWQALSILTYALLIPPAWLFAERFRFQSLGCGRWLVIHGIASLVFSSIALVFIAIAWQMQALIGHPIAFGQLPLGIEPSALFLNAWFFFQIIVAVYYGIDAYRHWQERKLTAAKLAEQLSQARLQALQMQLHPHFLFNTLQTIAVLVHRDPDDAERMLARLGELLRIVLDRGESSVVPLQQELEFLQRYLAIEQIRFGSRLSVGWEVDQDILDLSVPTLILQPLVENAVRHGISSQARPGQIMVGARRKADRLELWVKDNGPGLQLDGTPQGHGLANVRARLAGLYGPAGRLQLETGADGGLTATVEIPMRAAALSLVKADRDGRWND